MERAIRIERAWLCAVREMRDLDLIPGVMTSKFMDWWFGAGF
jgi:hypothetical protein